MEINEYLKFLRDSKKLSLSAVEEKTGITDSRLFRLENGKTKPLFVDVITLLDCYEVNVYQALCELGYIESSSNNELLNIDQLNTFEISHIQDEIDFIIEQKKEIGNGNSI
jgi:transcriptional regulator with XRE-family HTH domain